jgi:hypothetical protein
MIRKNYCFYKIQQHQKMMKHVDSQMLYPYKDIAQ